MTWLPCCINQEFREIFLRQPDQGVTFPVRYDRNAPGKPPSRLCPRQHLRARRSTAQLEQLRGAGCTKIYREKVTGAHSDRRELLKMLKAPRARRRGDGNADRPPRAQHLRPVRHRQADRGRQGAVPFAGRAVGRHRHQHRAADDRRSGGLADVERDLIRTRTAEGRSRAQKRGQHMGRTPKLTEAQKAEARRRRARRRHPCRTRPQLRRGQKHDFEAHRLVVWCAFWWARGGGAIKGSTFVG